MGCSPLPCARITSIRRSRDVAAPLYVLPDLRFANISIPRHVLSHGEFCSDPEAGRGCPMRGLRNCRRRIQ
jgi:hypothetical protein